MNDTIHTTISRDELIFGFGPMLPLVAAGLAVWFLPAPWPVIAIRSAVVWGALILAFIGGVRRGFGFASESASRTAEIAAATAYVAIAGLALILPRATVALGLLAAGYAIAAFLDRRAALRGNAPAYFAKLRPPQLLLGAAGLAACAAGIVL